MADLFDVLLRRHLVGQAAVAGNTPAQDDLLEVEVHAQFLARVVQAAGQAQFAVVGMDEHVDAVERVAVGVVVAQAAVADDLPVGVLVPEAIVVDDHADRRGDDLALGLDAELALAEHLELPREDLALPRTHVRVHAVHDLVDVVVVAEFGAAQRELRQVPIVGRSVVLFGHGPVRGFGVRTV